MKYSLLLSLLLFAGATCAFSDIDLSAPTQTIYAGQMFAVDIDIDSSVTNLNNIGFTLDFDPTLLTADDVVEGPLFTAAAAANNDYTIPAWNNVSSGSIAYADVLVFGSTVDGPGTVAVADFTALGPGPVSISFGPNSVILDDPFGGSISATPGPATTLDVTPTPEPASLWLLGTALGLMLFGMWRRSTNQRKGGAETIHF